MPSIRFFEEKDEQSALRNAYRRLLSNIPLILQILAVIGFAAALANPYITRAETSETKVMVLDTSASTSPDLENMKEKLEKRASRENTLITVGNEAKVVAEDASKSRLSRLLDNVKALDTETDIASGLQVASSLNGELVIASDLDQTSDNRDPVNILNEQIQRPVEVVKPDVENRWGITSVKPGENATEIEVTNFQQEPVSIKVSRDDTSKTIDLRDRESNIVRFESNTGRNTVTLPEDGMQSDNTAYFYIPEYETTEIGYIGEPNKYFREAVSLMKDVSVSEGYSEDAEVYFVDAEIEDRSTVEDVRSQVRQGGAAVVKPGSDALKDVFELDADVKNINTSVSINRPIRTSLGRDVYKSWNVSGTSLSNPPIIKRTEYGEGEILLYGIKSDQFGESFLYPVFWKKILQSLVERPSISSLNVETGSKVQSRELTSPDGNKYAGSIRLNKTGFYESESKTYASNLESVDESRIDTVNYTSGSPESLKTEKTSIRAYVIIAVIFLMLSDLLYIRSRGEF
ncbi:MAG: hypothetical protein J07AB43_16070 [Candidatus Nanosalina sp. J07AB43]|nr:MAG: hypothetical protein J07AB43_16070 [Candidatus Nanosalina sp. J07AB43]